MSTKNVTRCDSTSESRRKYEEYIDNHVRNVKVSYKKAINAFREIFPKVYEDNEAERDLQYHLECHDSSKFSNEEFWPYALKFFPANLVEPELAKFENAFDTAWLHHAHHNPHHPAYWVLFDNNDLKIYDMPDIYIIEMLCDWMAMSIHYNSTTLDYWNSYSAQMLPMSNYTRAKVDEFMKWMIKNNVHTLW